MLLSESQLVMTMVTSEQPDMEGGSLDLSSCKGKLSSFKSLPTSSLSVIYAPFTYPLSSLLLIPPLNSLVNIKEQASHLAHPLARLGHASQIFSSEKVKSPPSAQEAENWSLDDQACNAYSMKASLKPPVGAVVNSLTTIRTDFVDKVASRIQTNFTYFALAGLQPEDWCRRQSCCSKGEGV